MDSLTSPKFKSKVEQFYYDNRSSSEVDLRAAAAGDDVFQPVDSSPKSSPEKRMVEAARRRAYSGEHRGVFSFEPEDLLRIQPLTHGSLDWR
jgi:hypothetical protein